MRRSQKKSPAASPANLASALAGASSPSSPTVPSRRPRGARLERQSAASKRAAVDLDWPSNHLAFPKGYDLSAEEIAWRYGL